MTRNKKSTRDIVWQVRPLAAAPLRRWLLDRGSLTARIQARCEAFSVKLLFQDMGVIDRDEHRVIGVHAGTRCVVREVCLQCGERPVVFAHSVLAPGSVRGPWRMVANLGVRPLGAALFADPTVARHPLRFRKLGHNHELFRRARALLGQPPATLWARRSLFESRGSPILVTEVFLPEILEL